MSTEVRSRGDHPLADWKKLEKPTSRQIREQSAEVRDRANAQATDVAKQDTVAAQKAMDTVAGKIGKQDPAAKKSGESSEARGTKHEARAGEALDTAQTKYIEIKAAAGEYQKLVQSRSTPSATATPTQPKSVATNHEPSSSAKASADTQTTNHDSVPHAHAATATPSRDPRAVNVANALRGKTPVPNIPQDVRGSKAEARSTKHEARSTNHEPQTFNTVVRVKRGKEGTQVDGAQEQSAVHGEHEARSTKHEAQTTTAAAIAGGSAPQLRSTKHEARGPKGDRSVGKVGRAAKTGLAQLEAGARKQSEESEGLEPIVASGVSGEVSDGADDPAAHVYNATEKDAKFLQVRQAHQKYQAVEKPVDFSRFVALAERVQNYVVDALSKRVQGDPELVKAVLQASLGSPYGKNAVFG